MLAPPAQSKLPQMLADIGKPSLRTLSYALRHPDTWPKGFVWDYGDCESCAMALAHRLWTQFVPKANGYSGASIMAREFSMPYREAMRIFLADDGEAEADWLVRRRFFGLIRRVIDYDAVTPEMVADQIDLYLRNAA